MTTRRRRRAHRERGRERWARAERQARVVDFTAFGPARAAMPAPAEGHGAATSTPREW